MARVIFLTDFSEAYARELLLGMARYAHDTAQAWSLCRLPLSIRDKFGIEAVVEWAVRMKADAVIGQFYNTDNVGLFRENGIIAIAQDFKKRFTTIPNITGPHHLAGRMAAEYFLKKGFRNFAFYGTRGIDFSDERCQGFRETVEQANPDFTFSSLRSGAQNDLWYYDTAQLITWLQSLPKPVAIMACDDNQAYHITEACLQIEGGGNSRIPNDIAILGVDNDETICKLSAPNLSSLSQGVEQGGYDVARLIDRLIRNPEAEWEDVMVMPLNIITRQSTDIYANNDPHIAEVLRYIHENISQGRGASTSRTTPVAPPARNPFQKEHGHLDLRLHHPDSHRKDDAVAVRRAERIRGGRRAGLLRHQERLAHLQAAEGHHPVGIPRTGRPEKALAPSRKQVSRPFRSAQRSKFRHIGRFLRRIYYLRGKLTFKPNLCP